MTTINDLCVVSSFSGDDKLPMWQNANGVTRALPLSVLTSQFLTNDSIPQLAASPTVESFTAGTDFTPGTTLALALANSYLSGYNVEVFFDSAFQGPDQYSLSGNALVFISPIPVGVQKVYVRGGSIRVTASPSDGTITDVKVASGSKLWNRIKDTIDVKDFGAVGDGVVDDTTAIQAAINYVMALPRGGRLYFPTGIYNVTHQLTATLASDVSITFSGEGSASQLRWASGTNGSLLFVGANAPVFGAQIVFEDLRFSQPYGGTVSAVYLKNCNSAQFRNCSVYSYANGIILENSYNVRFFGCTVYGCAVAGISTNVTGTNSLIVHGCVISGNGIGVNVLVGGNNVIIRDNDLEANGIAVAMTNYTSVLIEGNYIENGTNVVFFFGGANYKIGINQNWLGANAVSTNFGNIVGGTFEHNTLYSSIWTTTATDFIIGDNYLTTGVTLPPTKWTAPTLLNGFTAMGVNYYSAAYIKKPDGTVTIRGNLLNGAAGAVIFNLPVGYRPTSNCTFATASSAAPGTSIIEVRSTGDVLCIARDGLGGTGLNGISFAAEQ